LPGIRVSMGREIWARTVYWRACDSESNNENSDGNERHR
jgi:hypothetical protein